MCGCLCWAGLGWAALCTRRAKRHAKASFLTAWGPGTGQQMAQDNSALPPPASACWSAGLTFSHWKGFWGNWEHGTSGSSVVGGAIQTTGKMVGVFPCPSATCLSQSQNISLTSAMCCLRQAGHGVCGSQESILALPWGRSTSQAPQDSGGQALLWLLRSRGLASTAAFSAGIKMQGGASGISERGQRDSWGWGELGPRGKR